MNFIKSINSLINKKSSGFTLIELLVVVAIIGILASIVIASLNSARSKGKSAAIKSNLRNMIAQMEISYLDNNNYSGINTGGTATRPNTNCLTTSSSYGMISSVINQVSIARCLSVNVSGWSDVLQRWGVTALLNTDTTPPINAYSASQQGTVKWDEKGVTTTGTFVTGNDVTMTWDQAVTACSLSGGRLPTVEELKTLADAECQRRGNEPCTTDSERNPAGFVADGYWSGTTVPSDSGNAYRVYFDVGSMGYGAKSSGSYVRCVR